MTVCLELFLHFFSSYSIYRFAEVSKALGKLDEEDIRQMSIDKEDRDGFRVGDLYKK